jgi:NADH-quinone oxidoreductase subunit J
VMMLDIDIVELRAGFMRYLPMGVTVAAIVFCELVFVFFLSLKSPGALAPVRQAIPDSAKVDNTHAIGNVLYTWYIYPFQMAGIILLIAMIGAIVLTLRSRPGVRKQSIARQVSRSTADSMHIVKVESGRGI